MSERGCGVSIPDLSRARWRTSSHSSGNGACVKVADTRPMVAVRDSKDQTAQLAFAPDSWQAFTSSVKSEAARA